MPAVLFGVGLARRERARAQRAARSRQLPQRHRSPRRSSTRRSQQARADTADESEIRASYKLARDRQIRNRATPAAADPLPTVAFRPVRGDAEYFPDRLLARKLHYSRANRIAATGGPCRSRLAREQTMLVSLVFAYVVSGRSGCRSSYVHPAATLVWPPAGIALGALLVLGYRMWPAIFASAVASVRERRSDLFPRCWRWPPATHSKRCSPRISSTATPAAGTRCRRRATASALPGLVTARRRRRSVRRSAR